MHSPSKIITPYKPSDVLDFGEHEGKTVEVIAREHGDYFTWLISFKENFFMIQEDIDALCLKYPILKIDVVTNPGYIRKQNAFEEQEFRAIFNRDMAQWANLTESARSKTQRERYPTDESLYFNLPYNDEFKITTDIHTWKFVKFGVDEHATPMMTVFCYSVRAINGWNNAYFERMGYHNQDAPVHYFKFTLTMNDFAFGYVARILVEEGMANTIIR